MSLQLLKPRWLLGHVLVVAFTVAFTLLGFWQLSRHFEQRDDNRILEARLAAPPLDIQQLGNSDAELRQAIVRGRYDYSRQLEVRPRARNGQVGYEQIVPLETEAGVLLVNRGFIPDSAAAGPTPRLTEEIAVTGTVRPSQPPSSLGPQNRPTGQLDTIARIDIERLNPQFGNVLLPVYLDLISESPPAGGQPTVLPQPPASSSRPNLPYAIQWWSFAVVVSAGWFLYLRKQFFVR